MSDHQTTAAPTGAARRDSTSTARPGPGPDAHRRVWTSAYLPIWPATAVLFAVSPLIAPGSLNGSALRGMLPFAAVLAIVGIGQTLVIQQRGLDLAVPGAVSLAAIIVTKHPGGDGGRLPAAIGLALLACAAAGLVSGLAVTRLRITPLVATLGVNALLLGTILRITSGSSTAQATPALGDFAFGRTLEIPNTVLVAVAALAVVAVVVRTTVVGRRFVAVGTNARAAYVAGLPVPRYQLLTYTAAGLCYGCAGILLAGYLRTPGLSAGDNYLLPSIAAVVLGGTSLAGGSGSVVATAGGCLFLTQLQQVVFGAGAPSSVQLLIQAGVIAAGMTLRAVPWRRVRRPRTATRPTGPAPPWPPRPEPTVPA
jgi:ribose transport system permease protein